MQNNLKFRCWGTAAMLTYVRSIFSALDSVDYQDASLHYAFDIPTLSRQVEVRTKEKWSLKMTSRGTQRNVRVSNQAAGRGIMT